MKEAVNTSGAAGLIWALRTTMKISRTTSVPVHLMEKVTAKITDSGEYTMRSRGDDYYVFKNPNRFFNQNLIDTNDSIRITNTSIRDLNTFQKRILAMSIGIAGLTTLFIILSYFEQKNDKSFQQLEELVKEVQQTSKSIDSIRFSIKELNSSVQKLKFDSLSVYMKSKVFK